MATEWNEGYEKWYADVESIRQDQTGMIQLSDFDDSQALIWVLMTRGNGPEWTVRA
jgi:hypothetical protein